jgi:hypothetical protein
MGQRLCLQLKSDGRKDASFRVSVADFLDYRCLLHGRDICSLRTSDRRNPPSNACRVWDRERLAFHLRQLGLLYEAALVTLSETETFTLKVPFTAELMETLDFNNPPLSHPLRAVANTRGVVVRRDDADIVRGTSHMEVLGDLLLVEEAVVATAHSYGRSLLIFWICSFASVSTFSTLTLAVLSYVPPRSKSSANTKPSESRSAIRQSSFCPQSAVASASRRVLREYRGQAPSHAH